ncbi:MAG: hypothetical protein AVDCRST_MAG59-3697, partial [uncultured Thermomicrobiales bacterium]
GPDRGCVLGDWEQRRSLPDRAAGRGRAHGRQPRVVAV